MDDGYISDKFVSIFGIVVVGFVPVLVQHRLVVVVVGPPLVRWWSLQECESSSESQSSRWSLSFLLRV